MHQSWGYEKKEKVNDYSEVFGLNSQKNGFLRCRKLWKAQNQRGRSERLSFEHMEFEMFINHLSRDVCSSRKGFRLEIQVQRINIWIVCEAIKLKENTFKWCKNRSLSTEPREFYVVDSRRQGTSKSDRAGSARKTPERLEECIALKNKRENADDNSSKMRAGI